MTELRFLGISLVLLAVLIEAFGQLCFKKAASSALSRVLLQEGEFPSGSNILRIFVQKCRSRLRFYFRESIWVPLGVVFFVVEGLVWTLALRYLEISVAQPLASVELVLVAFLSAIWFRERISRERVIGILFILSGTALVSFH